MKRRELLMGVGVTPFARGAFAQSISPDVLIIGGGTAGIAASRQLAALGLTSIILEARDRLGGRAFTDHRFSGQAFDIGAHWLKPAEVDPMVSIAEGMGIDLIKSNSDSYGLFEAGYRLPDADHAALIEAAAQIERNGVIPSLFGADRGLDQLADMSDPWHQVAMTIPMLEMAAEPDEISLADYVSLASGQDLQVAGGLGAMVAALGHNLNVRLGSSVTSISWQDRNGVFAEGDFGRVTARAMIVTLPTSVLAAEAIRFVPALPDIVMQAFADLPLGVFEKVGFVLDNANPELPEYASSPRLIRDGQAHAVHFSPDRRLATVMVVADAARALVADGPTALADFGTKVIHEILGTQARIGASLSTGWLQDPLARGAYSHAKVGATAARDVYLAGLEGRLWFAGEAAAGQLAGTVGGAWTSGQVTANAVATRLKG